MKTLGQRAYEAYSKFSHGKSLVSGNSLPVWDILHRDIKDAWEAAARAVVDDMFTPDEPSRL